MYKATIENPVHDVHDGDTLLNVKIKLRQFKMLGLPHNERIIEPVKIWPNLYMEEDGFYVIESIRLYGIDTAEMHPHKKDVHGNLRTDENIAMEKELAQKQRNALYDLLEKNDFQFWVKDAVDGKYAGRAVAKVLVGKSDDLIDAGEYLIENAGAHPYFGHTKATWS